MSSHNYGEHEEDHLARYYMSQGLPTTSDGRVGASNQAMNDDQHSTRRTAAADGLQVMSMLPVDSSPTTLYPPGRNQEYDDDEERRPVGIASNSLNSNTEITMEMVGLSHNTFSDNVQFQIPRFMQDPVGFDPAAIQHHLHPHQQMPKSTATPSAATNYQTVMSSAAMSSGDMFSGLVVARNLTSATSSVPTIDYPSTGHYHHAYVSTSTGVSNTSFAPFPYSAVPSNSHPYQPSALPGSESAVSSITATISQKLPRSSSLALNGLPIYSSSGFDMVDILARVATRPQPKVTLGPVDMSCAFLVTDVTREDSPIIYVSATFSELTGYTEEEIIGKNCRFLQAPPGVNLEKGGEREHTDIDSVTQMAQSVSLNRECQVTLINYRKSGEAFINCVTIIPIIPPGNEPVRYHVGFQVDLAVQPLAIMRSVQSGHYITNYSSSPLPPVMYQPTKPNVKSISKDMADVMNRIGDGSASPMTEGQDRHKLSLKILGESPDSVFIVSLKGSFLYVSPSISKLLKFDADYFLNKNLSDVCHPSDLAPVMRSIKESSTPLGNPNPGSTAPSNQPQTAPGAQD
ncbi:blue light receptor, partial [Serendipita sp. 398]